MGDGDEIFSVRVVMVSSSLISIIRRTVVSNSFHSLTKARRPNHDTTLTVISKFAKQVCISVLAFIANTIISLNLLHI